jgi:hypothetical protein
LRIAQTSGRHEKRVRIEAAGVCGHARVRPCLLAARLGRGQGTPVRECPQSFRSPTQRQESLPRHGPRSPPG